MTVLPGLVAFVLIGIACLALFTHVVGARVDATYPAPGQWIEVAGERLHYRSMGSGPPIVLVHGLGGESRNFDYLPLADLARRWRLVLVDRPGSGHSPRQDESQAGIAAQARILVAFLRAMQFDQPPLLVGHSLGGAIALSVALQAPHGIAGVALVAPLTHFDATVPKPFRALAIRSRLLRHVVARTVAAPLAILGTPMVLRELFGPDRAPHDFAVRGGGLRSLRPAAFVTSSTDLAGVARDLPAQQRRYGEIRLPVFVLHGEGDRILGWRAQAEALRQRVPHAKLRIIPGGHMLPVTQSAATATWLEDTARAVFG